MDDIPDETVASPGSGPDIPDDATVSDETVASHGSGPVDDIPDDATSDETVASHDSTGSGSGPALGSGLIVDIPDDNDDALVGPNDPSPVVISPTEQITTALLTQYEELSKPNDRKEVEIGLQAFNEIKNVCETIVDAIRKIDAVRTQRESIKLYCNPVIGILSDFTPHYKMLVLSANGDDAIEPIVSGIKTEFEVLIAQQMFQGNGKFIMKVTDATPFVDFGTQISLKLMIGEVFSVPVFTAYVMRGALNSSRLIDALSPIEPQPFTHNTKQIANYNRLDVLLELLLHSEESDIYDPVNVLVTRGIHASIVSKFESADDPDQIIKTECQPFFDMVLPDTLRAVIIKMILIAIMQDPTVKTPNGEQFSDIFPSGQYGAYFGEVAYRATLKSEMQGPIIIDAAPSNAPSNAPGDAPGAEDESLPILAREGASHPLTRTDIIVAAITAMNAVMRPSGAHIVAGGGAAVSFYIQEFLKTPESFMPQVAVANEHDIDINLKALVDGCNNIRMNDIDCIVFGSVSRRLLSVFSLYMMILYDNFFARPKKYGVSHVSDVHDVAFHLSKKSEKTIRLLMYGNQDDDANTKLISKRLKKDPKVQLVTQKTKYFSQIMHSMCNMPDAKCKEDAYYLEPIDLVKKTIEHFTNLYTRSLYPNNPNQANPNPPPSDLADRIKIHYFRDNMVSLKIIMLDIICIFCDEGASLFCRIFMARKNPKDFARLRVFIDMYFLQLLRADDTFTDTNPEFIADVRQLRGLMDQLNEDYYLKEGSIAAVKVETAQQLDVRRDEFLQVLRKVGRKIMELDEPREPVPMQFQTMTGENTVRFFKENAQMKYKFDMSRHMSRLFETYSKDVSQPEGGDEWLKDVFTDILFEPQTEEFFSVTLHEILEKNTDDATQPNSEIDFKDMPVMQSITIELLHALQKIHATGPDMTPLYNANKPLMYSLLNPIRNAKLNNSSAQFIGNEFDFKKSIDKRIVFKILVDKLLKLGLPANTALIAELEGNDYEFSKEVNTEIGRILLELNSNTSVKDISLNTRWGGGVGVKTIKCKRCCKLNARTRRSKRCNNRNTRKKRRANKYKCKRSHRAH